MVGASGVEPETFCTPSKRATRLRYAPMGITKTADTVTVGGCFVKPKQRVNQSYERMRSLYSPVRVSMRIMSPSLTKSGTGSS